MADARSALNSPPTNGIYEMVRNYLKNTDDGRHPYITQQATEELADLIRARIG